MTIAMRCAMVEQGYGTGLRQVRLGNCGVFARTAEGWEALLDRVGLEGIG